jgi:hypothetical protein
MNRDVLTRCMHGPTRGVGFCPWLTDHLVMETGDRANYPLRGFRATTLHHKQTPLTRGCSYIMCTSGTAELLLRMIPAWTLSSGVPSGFVCCSCLSTYAGHGYYSLYLRATTVLKAVSTLNCPRCTWPFATAWSRQSKSPSLRYGRDKMLM